MDQSLVGYTPWGHKSRTRLSDFAFTFHRYERASPVAQRERIHLPMQEMGVQTLGQEDPLEKEMAPHSSILAWEIPWTEEPEGLQSRGLQRV